MVIVLPISVRGQVASCAVRTLLSETAASGSLENGGGAGGHAVVFSGVSALHEVGNGRAGKCFPRGKGEFLGGLHWAWAAVQV